MEMNHGRIHMETTNTIPRNNNVRMVHLYQNTMSLIAMYHLIHVSVLDMIDINAANQVRLCNAYGINGESMHSKL